MDKGTEALICAFPGLASDSDFEITSKATPDYNCIAWACNYDNRWMQPPDGAPIFFDAVSYWPKGAGEGTDITCLIEAFATKGYSLCDSWEHEDGYQKVALYVKDGKWSHASRELVTGRDVGKWTSKMGQGNDIRHGTPFTIEGNIYGKVYCIMKREFK